MSKYTVVGTACNEKGELKVRWANDLHSRIKTLLAHGVTEIDLHGTPEPMSKLDAVKWYMTFKELSEDQRYVCSLKLAELERQHRRTSVKATITGNVDEAVLLNKDTDPRIAAFIEKTLAKQGS
jgi:hypothetical protein